MISAAGLPYRLFRTASRNTIKVFVGECSWRLRAWEYAYVKGDVGGWRRFTADLICCAEEKLLVDVLIGVKHVFGAHAIDVAV